jgi:hypothetical protein
MTYTTRGIQIRVSDLPIKTRSREPVFVLEANGSTSKIPLKGLSMMTGMSERQLIKMSDFDPDKLLNLILRR